MTRSSKLEKSLGGEVKYFNLWHCSTINVVSLGKHGCGERGFRSIVSFRNLAMLWSCVHRNRVIWWCNYWKICWLIQSYFVFALQSRVWDWGRWCLGRRLDVWRRNRSRRWGPWSLKHRRSRGKRSPELSSISSRSMVPSPLLTPGNASRYLHFPFILLNFIIIIIDMTKLYSHSSGFSRLHDFFKDWIALSVSHLIVSIVWILYADMSLVNSASGIWSKN